MEYLGKGFSHHKIEPAEGSDWTGLNTANGKLVMFGGKNRDGLLPNYLIMIKYSKSRCTYERLTTSGVPPAPRYNHTMNYMKSMNTLCVYGGQCDGVHSETESGVMGRVFVINMGALVWSECRVDGGSRSLDGRHSHAAVCNRNSIIIMGGIGEDGFMSHELNVLSFDELGDDRYEDYGDKGEVRRVNLNRMMSTLNSPLSKQNVSPKRKNDVFGFFK